jgi:hypothetical protein
MQNVELWAEYAIGAIFLCLRLFTRLKVAGITNIRPDDIAVLVALV